MCLRGSAGVAAAAQVGAGQGGDGAGDCQAGCAEQRLRQWQRFLPSGPRYARTLKQAEWVAAAARADLSFRCSNLISPQPRCAQPDFTGGMGGSGGQGESELQLQRRRVTERRKLLLRRLEEVRKTRAVQRAARQRSGKPQVRELLPVATEQAYVCANAAAGCTLLHLHAARRGRQLLHCLALQAGGPRHCCRLVKLQYTLS